MINNMSCTSDWFYRERMQGKWRLKIVLCDVSTGVREFVMEVLPFLPAWRKHHKINYVKFQLDFYFLF